MAKNNRGRFTVSDVIARPDLYWKQHVMSGSKAHTAEVRKAYTTLRDAAEKQRKRMENSPYSDSEILKNYNRPFKRLSEIPVDDKKALSNEMARMASFVRNPMASVAGQKKHETEMIKTLRDQGIKIRKYEYNADGSVKTYKTGPRKGQPKYRLVNVGKSSIRQFLQFLGWLGQQGVQYKYEGMSPFEGVAGRSQGESNGEYWGRLFDYWLTHGQPQYQRMTNRGRH